MAIHVTMLDQELEMYKDTCPIMQTKLTFAYCTNKCPIFKALRDQHRECPIYDEAATHHILHHSSD